VYIAIYTNFVEIDMVEQTLAECLVVASEECAELTKECMKILRFGMSAEKRDNLVAEMGDVHCMLELLKEHFDLPFDDIMTASNAKKEKLKKWSNLIK